MNKYFLHKTTNPYLKRVRSHKEKYSYNFLGKRIVIFPNVMSPKYDWSPEFHIKNMPDQKNKRFLEIGCGSGIISLFAGLQGAREIISVDINFNAIKNTEENLKSYKIKSKVFYSDLFEKVEGKFDTINFAAPYHGNKPKNILEKGVSDENYKTLKKFMREAKNHLEKNGQIILGFSDTGDIDLLNHLIIENKYFLKKRYEKKKNGWTSYLYILEPIKFETKKQEYVYNSEYNHFKEYINEIKEGKILKVGSGIGYSSYFINLYNENLKVLEISSKSNKLVKNLVLYDGKKIPYKGKEFDCVLCIYVLHHAKYRDEILDEIIRVSKNKIILVEETYKNKLSKIILMLNDFISNLKAKQKVTIMPNKYYKEGDLDKIFKENNLRVVKKETKKKYNFNKEFFIVEK